MWFVPPRTSHSPCAVYLPPCTATGSKGSTLDSPYQSLPVPALGLRQLVVCRAFLWPTYYNSKLIIVLQSIRAVRFWQFVVATTVVFPKVALHVFIGSRLASLSDGETRRQMDTRKAPQLGSLVLLLRKTIIRNESYQCSLDRDWRIRRNLDQLVRRASGSATRLVLTQSDTGSSTARCSLI